MNASDGRPAPPDDGDRTDPSLYLGGWDRSTLPGNVVVGRGCYIESERVFERFRSERQPGMVLGRGVRIHTWTSFSVDPTGYVEVGDGSVLVGALLMCADRVSIGRDVVVSYQVTIADSDFHPLDPALRRADAIANAPGGDRSRRPRRRDPPGHDRRWRLGGNRGDDPQGRHDRLRGADHAWRRRDARRA